MKLEKELAREVYLGWVKKANEASEAYYDKDDPIMSDVEFDELMQKIKGYEMRHQYVAPDSPTQRVGGSQGKSTFAKVTHEVPMLSLQDVFDIKDVYGFVQDNLHSGICVEEKIDGLSLSVTYEYGKLVRAETRGDGYIGEDITENAKCIVGIPRELNTDATELEVLEVRCEVYLPVASFLALNEKMEREGKKTFANPRNAAAGLLRTKDIEIVKNAGLHAFAFNVQRSRYDKYNNFGCSHTLDLQTLKAIGFAVVPSYYFVERYYGSVSDKQEKLKDIEAKIAEIGSRRNDLPYWIDGAVLKVDGLSARKQLGETNKYPRWALAFKYPPEEKETVIRDIILQTGRTGRVTPVAILDPVLLGGTTVTRATLNNPEFIKDLGVDVGDTVLVRKAAEIIPEIIRVTKKSDKNSVYDMLGQRCPSCGKPLYAKSDENGETSGAYCENMDCPAQIARKFEFFASRECMDIRGLGPALIDKFIEKGWLQTLPDIYRLQEHRDEMIGMDGLGDKAADKLFAAIEESKDRDIDRLIKALGIPGIGRHIGKELAKRYEDMWAIGAVSAQELAEIDGVGEISANAIYDAFHKAQQSNSDDGMFIMLNNFQGCGVNLKSKSFQKLTDNKNLPLAGKIFVITGTLPTMKREEAAELIEKNGGKVSSSVSKKTDYLLCGENAGSKLDKAKTLGVTIIDEGEFKNLI